MQLQLALAFNSSFSIYCYAKNKYTNWTLRLKWQGFRLETRDLRPRLVSCAEAFFLFRFIWKRTFDSIDNFRRNAKRGWESIQTYRPSLSRFSRLSCGQAPIFPFFSCKGSGFCLDNEAATNVLSAGWNLMRKLLRVSWHQKNSVYSALSEQPNDNYET